VTLSNIPAEGGIIIMPNAYNNLDDKGRKVFKSIQAFKIND